VLTLKILKTLLGYIHCHFLNIGSKSEKIGKLLRRVKCIFPQKNCRFVKFSNRKKCFVGY
jgi:hypothetical protein